MNKPHTASSRLLDAIEAAGNRVPHPALLFFYLALGVIVLSWFAAHLGWGAIHPLTGERVNAVNLLSAQGLQRILEHTVSNFTSFAPVGTVMVAMLGIGIADRAGLLQAIMRALVLRAPDSALTFAVVFAGVLSSLAADAGYVVLIPLAATLFQASGRHPLAGIAAAFSGVSAGYSANLLIGPLDAMLAGISTEAAQLVDPTRSVSPASNYYFMACSTVIVAALATWITERVVQPRLAQGSNTTEYPAQPEESNPPDTRQARALRAVAWFSAVFATALLFALAPAEGILRSADGSILSGPFVKGIVTVVALYFAVAGSIYGLISGRFRNGADIITSMEASMATMAGYLVLMFFAAQFINYFAWTELGLITAIQGAAALQKIGSDSLLILLLFVLLAATINLLVGSASAKWSIMAPVFVPMFMLYGIPAEATQVAYRIGDSSTNIITPLMPYFGIVVAFAQRYVPQAGVGTIIALMLPYAAALLLGWTTMLTIWMLLGWPLGA